MKGNPMTNPAILTVKTIAALIEASDAEDTKDAEQVLKMIRALLDTTEKKA